MQLLVIGQLIPACTTSRFSVFSKIDEAFTKNKRFTSVHAQIAVHNCHVKHCQAYKYELEAAHRTPDLDSSQRKFMQK